MLRFSAAVEVDPRDDDEDHFEGDGHQHAIDAVSESTFIVNRGERLRFVLYI